MGRAFYPSEIDDPDLDWLVSNFLYENPDFVPIETGMLPVMLLPYKDCEVEVQALVDIDFSEEE